MLSMPTLPPSATELSLLSSWRSTMDSLKSAVVSLPTEMRCRLLSSQCREVVSSRSMICCRLSSPNLRGASLNFLYGLLDMVVAGLGPGCTVPTRKR